MRNFNRTVVLASAVLFIALGCDVPPAEQQPAENNSEIHFRLAYGSCSHQDKPLEIFHKVVEQKPELFIFLGDNIYGDTKVMDTLRAKYSRLAAKPSFQSLKNGTTLLATWDDHDYGWNDAGKEYEFKAESKAIFLDFFEEPESSARWEHEGIYHSIIKEKEGKILQIILLDTRTFRDSLIPYGGEVSGDHRYKFELAYGKIQDEETTFLGEQQWKWLAEQLRQPADVRVIASSTTFSKEYNGYEGWANYPLERQRMLHLIKETKAEGVVFISGDLHYAEISKLEAPGMYPIYDASASGLSQTWYYPSPNKRRIEGPVMKNNFGLMDIYFGSENTVHLQCIDDTGNERFDHVIALETLRF